MTDIESNDEWLTTAQSAELWHVRADTWRSYVRRGYAPPPDDPDEDRPANRRAPRWKRSTVLAAYATRRGLWWRAGQSSTGSTKLPSAGEEC